MAWRGMATAPTNGTMVRLKLAEPIHTDMLVGYVPPQIIWEVLGWASGGVWECCFMDEGTADTEGHSSPYPMTVKPIGWAPMEQR